MDRGQKTTRRDFFTRPLLSPAEAAEILGVKVDTLTVWRCTKRYNLPWVKVGRSPKYRPEDIEAFISERTVGVEG